MLLCQKEQEGWEFRETPIPLALFDTTNLFFDVASPCQDEGGEGEDGRVDECHQQRMSEIDLDEGRCSQCNRYIGYQHSGHDVQVWSQKVRRRIQPEVV